MGIEPASIINAPRAPRPLPSLFECGPTVGCAFREMEMGGGGDLVGWDDVAVLCAVVRMTITR